MSTTASPPSPVSVLLKDAKKWSATGVAVVTEVVQWFTSADSPWGAGAEHLQTVALAGAGGQLLVMTARRIRQDVKLHVDSGGVIRFFKRSDEEGRGSS